MGAGILPTAIHQGRLYFLFGRENKFADTPGFSDFGGGTEPGETDFETAVREGTEELTGFLGTEAELRQMLSRHGTYKINGDRKYRLHIFPYKFDEALPHYYNNNQLFLQKRLDPKIIQESKIFEKAHIEWIPVKDLLKRLSEFRSYFQLIVKSLVAQRHAIFDFVNKAQRSQRPNKSNYTAASTRRPRQRRRQRSSASKTRQQR